MTRAVLDANVLISALLNPTGSPAQVVDLWLDGGFVVVLSEHILSEFGRALQEPRLSGRVRSPLSVSGLTGRLRASSELVPGALQVAGVCRDPADNDVLACAGEGRAHYIVTGDRDLLELASYEGVLILDPAAFLRATSRE